MILNKVKLGLLFAVLILAAVLLFYIYPQEGEDYKRLLEEYPEIEGSVPFRADFLDEKILYPFEGLYAQIIGELSESEFLFYEQILEECKPEMEGILFAYPGYEYTEVEIYDVNIYDPMTYGGGSPAFLSVTLLAALDPELVTDEQTRDQYDFLVHENDCDARNFNRAVPKAEQPKIIAYVLRLPEVGSDLNNKRIDEVSVSGLGIKKDGKVEATVSFKTDPVYDTATAASYHATARLDMLTGELTYFPYERFEWSTVEEY